MVHHLGRTSAQIGVGLKRRITPEEFITDLIEGQFSNPDRLIASNTPEGWPCTHKLGGVMRRNTPELLERADAAIK
jgi:hypothetical protein